MSEATPTGFERQGEDQLWAGHHLRVARGTFVSPAGEAFTRELVRTPGAVAIVPLLDDGDTVLAIRQYRAPLDALVLEIPAGLLDVEGEDLATCARRELVEEVGYEPTELVPLLHAHLAAGFTDHAITVFLGTGLVEVGADRQGPEEEHMTVERLSLREAPALIADGTLTDAKTIMGLLAAREHLGPTR